MHLDSMAVSEAAYQLGMTHFRYAEYGLKPHFLDLWRQHLETLVKKLRFTDPKEQAIFCEAFCDLTAFVAETMNFAYSQCQQQAALNSRKKPDRDSPKS
ncbi:unnamed protein product [Heligmosomoides polygyrus]|uniref:HTH araC/xylS-type domain-containing protein n=1 Tax=Heligmosomoides polygyrus TaxID=6339 RepID=A0A3P7YXK5_HELPZ|nr:unnamed protein product [Heligmosomoides polygyrus]